MKLFSNVAAEPTLERIRRDHDQAPAKLQPMLRYVEAHLFEVGLTVNRLKHECGIRDNSVAIHFHACLGQPPHAYITSRRMEIAARMLATSDLPVWRVSESLGFSSIQVFSRAFYRAMKMRPSAYRRIHQPPASRGEESDTLAKKSAHSTEATEGRSLLERALAGELPDTEAANLIRLLLDLYPPRRQLTERTREELIG